MITDLVVSAVTDFLKASGRSELSSVTFFERDFGGDLTYPACIVTATINDLIGDDEAVIEHLSQFMQCNDSLGGQGTTQAEDGYRVTTFTVEIKAAAAS